MKSEEIEFDLEKLDDVELSNRHFSKKRLIIWFFRWVIGFSIIWAVVSFKPILSWLW
ncbi:hypothetical protein [Exilibacterium tricleocarpae]|uniref:hypothetical protein n=1 Tax=Exilibacterium tricleocarpae TaxID=2591008 RepID=UPI0015D30E7C|nr:hypothetical protein [Exilibacterium tricleocarpae]